MDDRRSHSSKSNRSVDDQNRRGSDVDEAIEGDGQRELLPNLEECLGVLVQGDVELLRSDIGEGLVPNL